MQSNVGNCLCVEALSADELQAAMGGRGERAVTTALYCNLVYIRGRKREKKIHKYPVTFL